MATPRPPRASLVNLADNTEFLFVVNPHTLEETIEAHDEEKEIVGLSHTRLQFKGTGNLSVPIELFMSDELDRIYGDNNDQQPTTAQKKAWLQSLVYPVSSQDYSRVGRPKVLLVWPNVIRIVARVQRIKFMHREFHWRDLHTTSLVATISLVEDLDRRKLMEDVTVEGSLHAGEDI